VDQFFGVGSLAIMLFQIYRSALEKQQSAISPSASLRTSGQGSA